MAEWKAYHYLPSLAGAIIFAALFFLSFFTLICFLFNLNKKLNRGNTDRWAPVNSKLEMSIDDGGEYARSHKKRLLWATSKYIPLLIGCLMEGVGYLFRISSHFDPNALGPYIGQSLLLLIAPAFQAATIYMLFGRMLNVLEATQLSIVPSRFITTTFVTGDVISFLAQAGGGGLMSQESTTKIGSKVVVAGLIIQIIFFGLFTVSEIKFTTKVKSIKVPNFTTNWSFYNYNLLICSILILIRSVVRVVEFIQGSDGVIMSHEWYIYVFDAVPMFLVMVSFLITTPIASPLRLESEKMALDTYGSANETEYLFESGRGSLH